MGVINMDWQGVVATLGLLTVVAVIAYFADKIK